jgi:hypothetical protein
MILGAAHYGPADVSVRTLQGDPQPVAVRVFYVALPSPGPKSSTVIELGRHRVAERHRL